MTLRLMSKTYWRGTWIRFREPVDGFAACEAPIATAVDGGQSRGLYWTPRAHPRPRVAVIAAHPRVDFSQHYAFPGLLRAGYACLGANLRTLGNDLTCVHEQLLLDLAAWATWLRDARGVERIVWLGNSGGGSLGCFYQAQAKLLPAQRIGTTPAGRPVPLAAATMPPFDAMMITAAHTGQGRVVAETIDPAVVDEARPLLSDASLDMYDPANGFVPAPGWSTYDPAFVARYRAAQLARVERLDALARAMIDEQRDADAARTDPAFDALPASVQRSVMRRAAFQPVMVIHRTMANLHYVDRSIDPSPRGYGSLLSERPDLMNWQLQGFARIQTPDAWLSTWSALSSNADALRNAPSVTEPVIVASAGRDLDVYPRTHTRALLDALGSADLTHVDFPHRLHYFEPDATGPGAEADDAGAAEQMDVLVPWLESRMPL